MCGSPLTSAVVKQCAAVADAACDARVLGLVLRVIGALSGETILERLEASEDWSVRRLKLAIARQEGSGASLSLLFEGRLLDDSEVLTTFIPTDGHAPAVLALVRSPRPAVEFRPAPARRLRAESAVSVCAESDAVSIVSWRVTTKALASASRHLAAPTFSLPLAAAAGDVEEVPFKLALCTAGSGSFQKDRSLVYVQVKCMGDMPEPAGDVDLRLWVARCGRAEEETPMAVAESEELASRHCFGASAAARLPRCGGLDLAAALLEPAGCCDIMVEIARRAAAL